MDQDKKGTYQGGMWMIILFAVIIIGDWLITMDFVNFGTGDLKLGSFIDFFKNNKLLIRSFYCVLLPVLTYLVPSVKRLKNTNPEDRSFYLAMAVLMTAIVVYGYETEYYYYNIIYPIIFIAHITVTARAMATFKSKLVTTDVLGGVSNVTDRVDLEDTFTFETDKGLLRVHNPYQGVLVEGGAGAGKSASLIEPMIHEGIQNGYAALIYDFKGNPPTLGLTGYNSMMHAKSMGKTPADFAMVNFSNLELSVRVNPISPKYITDYLSCQEAVDGFMKSLNKEWIEKSDFWSQSAIGYVQGIAWRLLKDPKLHKFCTLPHVISLVLNDYEDTLEWLMADKEIAKLVQPIAVAHKKGADQQLAGQVASAQTPMTPMYDKSLYWILSPKDDEMFSLDISDKENPKILSICNDPMKQQALSPAISLIISTIKQKINQQGKNKCGFIIDELPTIYIKDLDALPATGRSNKISTILGLQDRTQLIRDYGKKNSDTVLSNLGNIFVGMTNNLDTAKTVCSLVGKNEVHKTSYSTSSESVSTSESLQLQDVLQPKDIQGQSIGHFTGKIAGGKPALFSAQLPEFKHKDVYRKKYTIDDLPLIGIDDLNKKVNFINTADPRPELERKIFEQLVELNFNTINNEVDALLEPFKKIAE